MGLKLGLLSTANINAKLVAGARDVADVVDVVAVASRDREKARAHADELGIERAHGSYEDLLSDPEVDAVYISLPNSLHVPWSLHALEAGKHVLCEKPLARRAAEVERAFDTAERAGRVLAEAFMWRHHPQAKLMRELLPRIGELRLVRGAFSFPLSGAGNIRRSSELEGGALMDVGCYCVSAARLLCGEPEAAAAHQVIGGEGVDVRMTATLRFPGDVLAHFDCAIDAANRDELEVVGSEGSLFLDDPWHSNVPVIEVRGTDGSVESVEADRANPYGCQLRDFAAAVDGAPHPFGRADAVGQARAIELLYASAA